MSAHSQTAPVPTQPTGPVTFGIIGAGWRAEFYLRIANALPERFRVAGVVTNNAQTRVNLIKRFGVSVYSTANELLKAHEVLFLVVAVKKTAAPQVLSALLDQGVAVLAETPVATDSETLFALFNKYGNNARLQVAEQYAYTPANQARLSIIASNFIGEPNQARVSLTQAYHSISLLRRFLGVGFQDATVQASRFSLPLVAGPGRKGLPEREVLKDHPLEIAVFDWGGKVGIHDYQFDQHRSYVRTNRVNIRGERGEIDTTELRWLEDFATPHHCTLERRFTGTEENLDGLYLAGYEGGGKWWYRNPYAPARLSDDELAIANCLDSMARFLSGDPSRYSLAEAAEDQYLALLLEEAIQSGKTEKTGPRPWA